MEDNNNDDDQGPVQTTYEREDERWSSASQSLDWITLLIIGIGWAFWMLVVYFLEPGIR